MKKIIGISTLVLLETIGPSAYAYAIYLPSVPSVSQASPGFSALNIYLSDPPPRPPNLGYVLVNATSMTMEYSSNVVAMTATETVSGLRFRQLEPCQECHQHLKHNIRRCVFYKH